MLIQWNKEANIALRQALTYIRQDNPEASQRLASAVQDKVKQLEKFPYASRDAKYGFREAILKDFPYFLVFRITSNEIIYIVDFRHMSRKKPKKWKY